MKILLVIHFFPPKHNSGSENATYFLATELAKKHEVTVFTSEPDTDQEGFHEVYTENNFRVIKIHKRIADPQTFKNTYQNEEMDAIFEKYIDEINPDVVHFQHLIILSLNFLKIVKERKIPIIYTLHDFWFECPQIKRYFRKSNCLPPDDSRCEECLGRSFPGLVNSENKYKSNLFVNGIVWLLSKRFLKRITNFILDKFSLRKMLYEKREGFITKRNKDFLDYFKVVDLFVTPSGFLANEAARFGINRSKIITIAHGIPIPDPYPFAMHTRGKKDKIVFCFMSHIIMEKGFFLLMDAFKKLLGKYQNIKLVLYGTYDKGYEGMPEALKEIEEMEEVEYRGQFNNKEVGKVLSEVDVTVIPSLWQEIYGLVLDESFLYGVPVVVSNRGALPERVKDGKNGLIFDPDKENDLYNKMEMIAKTPRILDDFRKNIPRVKSIEKYAEEIEKLYFRFVG